MFRYVFVCLSISLYTSYIVIYTITTLRYSQELNVNFLVLPYQSINTSGQYFLSIKYNLPVIAPNLPFFLYHGSNKNIIYYDYDEPIINHIEKIHKNIKNFKYTNSKKLNQKYYDENEYKKITEILNDL